MSTYIFDFDGTLGDSMPFFSRAIRIVMESNGINCTDELVNKVTPMGYAATAQYLREEYNVPYTTDGLRLAFDEILYEDYKKHVLLKEHVVEYLTLLKAKGHSLNILSAGQEHYFSAVLKRCGLFELFDNAWCCDVFNMTKSNPKIYLEAVKRTGGKLDDTFFFDDNVEAIRAAVKSGIHVIGVYDKSSEVYAEEIKATAERYILSWKELL